MDLKKKIAMVMVLILATLVLPSLKVEAAQHVTKQQQILFIKEQLPITLEKEKEYGIPHELALAQGAYESKYGTSDFARAYYNLTGYACYPDESGGPVVCHKDGQFSSYDECWDAYFSLLAEDYGKADWYMTVPKQLVRDIADTYCPGSPAYADQICGMIDTVTSLESEVVAMQEAEDAAAAEMERVAKVELEKTLAKLGNEKIYIRQDVALKHDGLVAGATAAVFKVQVKEMTVKEAANQVSAGKLGDFAERKSLLGAENYAKVQEYLQLETS